MRSLHSFRKALRYCWPYRWRIVLAWAFGLAGTLMWAGSLSAVEPLFNILFRPPARGLHVTEVYDPSAPGDAQRVLEADPSWEIVQDESVAELEVRGRTIRVPPGIRVVRPETGLGRLAASAESKGEPHAPALRWMASHFPADRYQALLAVMGVMAGMLVARGGADYAYEFLVGHATARAILAIRLRVYDHVLRSRLALFARTGASQIMSRFQQDTFYVVEGLKTILGKTIVMPPRALVCLAGALYFGVTIDPLLPVTVFVAIPVVGLLVRQFARLMRRASRKALESRAVLLQNLEESLFGIRVVKGYHLEGYQRRRFFHSSRRLFRNLLRSIRIQAITSPAVETLFTVAGVAAVAVGGRIVIERFDPDSFGRLTAFFALLAGALDPVRKLSNVSNRLQQAAAGADRVFALLQEDPEPRYGARGHILPRHRRSVEFRGVTFGYDPDQPVLRDVDLSVDHGEVVAIVGRTGCGKTTLVSLLPRFFEPDRGRILIDGTDIADVTLRSLREQLAIVPQETVLFADTVERNIAVGAMGSRGRGPGREAVVAAARAAHADAFIRALPHGYDTVIGERGTTLSGGQRQRLALARAIIRDPAVLLLDEATSALDEETQTLVQATLREFVRGRTTFLVAHRLSTLAIADRIVVMEAGRIVDVGTHEQLLEACETYRRLQEAGLEGP